MLGKISKLFLETFLGNPRTDQFGGLLSLIIDAEFQGKASQQVTSIHITWTRVGCYFEPLIKLGCFIR